MLIRTHCPTGDRRQVWPLGQWGVTASAQNNDICAFGLREKRSKKWWNLVFPTDSNQTRTNQDECRSRTDYTPRKFWSETAVLSGGPISRTIAPILLSDPGGTCLRLPMAPKQYKIRYPCGESHCNTHPLQGTIRSQKDQKVSIRLGISFTCYKAKLESKVLIKKRELRTHGLLDGSW